MFPLSCARAQMRSLRTENLSCAQKIRDDVFFKVAAHCCPRDHAGAQTSEKLEGTLPGANSVIAEVLHRSTSAARKGKYCAP